MGVADPRDIIAAGSVLHGKRGLIDHFAGAGPDDVSAEQTVSLLVPEDLHEAVGFVVALRSKKKFGIGYLPWSGANTTKSFIPHSK